jgi:hypothetical protein
VNQGENPDGSPLVLNSVNECNFILVDTLTMNNEGGEEDPFLFLCEAPEVPECPPMPDFFDFCPPENGVVGD